MEQYDLYINVEIALMCTVALFVMACIVLVAAMTRRLTEQVEALYQERMINRERYCWELQDRDDDGYAVTEEAAEYFSIQTEDTPE